MKFSRKSYFLLIALVLLAVVSGYAGKTPVNVPEPPDIPFPDDPPDLLSDPFTDPPDLPDPFELDPPWEDPFDDLPPDLLPVDWPDPPGLEDPFPDFPSQIGDNTLGYSAAPAFESAAAPSPSATATNTRSKLMPFPMRIPFHPAYSGTPAPRRRRICNAATATQLIFGEPKRNTIAFVNTCPYQTVAHVPVGIRPVGLAGTPDGQLALVANCGPDCLNFSRPSIPGSISVVNIASRTVTRTINFQTGPDGSPVLPNTIGILPDGSRAYVGSHSCTRSGSFIFIIDMSTFQVIGNIPVGCFPSAVVVTPDGSQLWVSSHGDNRVDVFDTATNQTLGGF